MSGINKVMLVGHIGDDPGFCYIGIDIAITTFSLVTTERILKNGNETEHVERHNIVMKRGVAEHAFKVLKKGKLICVEGKLQTRSLIDQSGVKRYITEILAGYFRLLGRSSDFEEVPERRGL